MSVNVMIPTALRSYAGGLASIPCSGDTVAAALASLTEQHPGLANHLRTKDGKLRSFVNIYLDDEDVRNVAGEDTAGAEGATRTTGPSSAGGQWA